MKKSLIRCAIFLLFLSLSLLPAAAEDFQGDVARQSEAIADLLSDFRGAIPPEVAALLPEGFFAEDMGEVADSVAKAGALSTVLGVVGRLTGLSLSSHLSMLAGITALLLISALFRSFAARGGTTRAVSFVTTLGLAVLLFAMQRERFQDITLFFQTMHGLGVAMVPLMGVLFAMGGNVRAAAVNSGVMSVFLSLLQTVCSATVLPVAGIALTLALLDALGTGLDLRPLAGVIKRTYTLTLSFLMLLLCGVLGLQSTLAKATDTMALRTARFAAGSFLPVVGGSVSEALRTVAGSIEYLRGVVGSGAILVLTLAFLPSFLSAFLGRTVFLLSGAAAKLLGCEREEKLLSEFGSVYGYFMAVIASVFVMMVFSLTLFARCAAAG